VSEPRHDDYHVPVDPAAENNPHSIALRMVGSGRHVLEIGCWSGHVTEHLVAAGNTVVGVEIDDDAAERNTHVERMHVVDLDAVELSTIEHDRFDAIVLGDVLEHLRDPATVLADLVGLLADDGVLVISVPHVGHVDLRLHLLSGRWEYQTDGLLDSTHLRWFTRAGLRELLAGVGFVATELAPVRFERGVTGLPVDEPIPHDALRYVDDDPDSRIFQFVVTARRGDHPDALAPIAVEHQDIDGCRAADTERVLADIDALRDAIGHRDTEIAALRAELDAWRNSKLARATAPLRSVYARIRRR
jgi:SAM-dependent methyltransferase